MKKKEKELVRNVITHGTLKKVKYTLKKHKLVFNKSFFDYELLKTALARKHRGITNFLLKKDCRVRNPKKNQLEGDTALHLAVKLNSTEIINKLLLRGASVYDINRKGNLPICAAFMDRLYNVVDLILDYCCNLTNLNPEDKTHIVHFHIACIRNNLKVAKFYVASGFDVNIPLNLGGIECTSRLTRDSYNSLTLCKRVEISPGMTPLTFAAREGFTDIVQLFLENGADVNKADKKGNTVLHELCKDLSYSNLEILRDLLEYNANLDAVNKNGCTPLHIAFYYVDRKTCIFDILLEKESWGPTNFTNDKGLSYFHIVCTTNNVNQVKKYFNSIENIDCTVASGMYSGYTALHFAILFNQKEVVELLLKKNAQVNIKASDKEITPLHLACEYHYLQVDSLRSSLNLKQFYIFENWELQCENQLEIIKLLILHGAYIEAKDSLGKTPLFYAGVFDKNFVRELSQPYPRRNHLVYSKISDRFQSIIDLLLSYGAHFEAVTNNLSSILHFFSEISFVEIPEKFVKLAIYKGLDVNKVNDDGFTPLHVAVKFNNKRMVQHLIKYKANINAKDTSKDSLIPLHIMIHNDLHSTKIRNIDIFCNLLKYGSNINIEYKIQGKKTILLHDTVFHRICFAVEKLLHYGADINMKDSRGNTAIYYFLDESYDFWWGRGNEEILISIVEHVQKLLALELYVSNEVNELTIQILQNYKERTNNNLNFESVYNDCCEEKKRMKLIKVDHKTSLHSILKKSSQELMRYVQNPDFTKIFDERVDQEFSQCGHLLRVQYRRGLVRRDILQSAEASLISIIDVDLPDLCIDFILQYLSNEDLDHVITAATMD